MISLRRITCFAIGLARLTAAEPRLVLPDSEKLLALDTRLIAHVENARLKIGLPVKEPGNPLLRADQPWENATNNYYPNVLWDADEHLWKLWYKDVLADKEAIAQMDSPSTVHDVGWYLLYATSKDGLSWERPVVGLHAFGGSKANNIVARDCPNVGVFKDEHDPNPSRRYKMVFDVGLGQPRARFSPDGIHWTDSTEISGFTAQQGDTHNNAFFDTRLGKYLWFTKLYLGERLVTRLESDDFQHWRSSGVVLRSTLEEGRATQTYALTVFPYANLWLGYAMMYHVGAGRTVDVELAWSPDSVHWQRVQPGTPFLPLGEKGSYDSGCIYAQAGPAVLQDGHLLIYYGGSPTVHLGWKRSGDLCLARLREDGFAYYAPTTAAGPSILTTEPLKPGNKPLRLIADGDVKFDRLDEQDGVFRLKLFLSPGARFYGIEGATLARMDPPAEASAPLPSAAPRESLVVDFKDGAQGWQGVDRLEHNSEGFISVSRQKGLRPIAFGAPLAGDWPVLLGGQEADLAARVRSAKPGGSLRMEIFARDVAQWSYENLPPFATEWQTVRAHVRYDWTDEQARAAGWTRAAHGFSWRETIRNVGKIVIMAGQSGSQASFDISEVRIEPH